MKERGREGKADGGEKGGRKIDEPIGMKFGGRNYCQAKKGLNLTEPDFTYRNTCVHKYTHTRTE